MVDLNRRSPKEDPIDPRQRWLVIFVILSCITFVYYHLFLEIQRLVGGRTVADVLNNFCQEIYKCLKSLW